jgi:hypothetical protein
LDDIIKEVNRQIASMQRQAAKARRYQTLLAEIGDFLRPTRRGWKSSKSIAKQEGSEWGLVLAAGGVGVGN